MAVMGRSWGKEYIHLLFNEKRSFLFLFFFFNRYDFNSCFIISSEEAQLKEKKHVMKKALLRFFRNRRRENRCCRRRSSKVQDEPRERLSDDADADNGTIHEQRSRSKINKKRLYIR